MAAHGMGSRFVQGAQRNQGGDAPPWMNPGRPWSCAAASGKPWPAPIRLGKRAAGELAGLADAAASEVDRWRQELGQVQEEVGNWLAALQSGQWPWQDSERQSLGDGHSQEEGRQAAVEGLERWLGSDQVVDELCKRLLWRISPGAAGGEARISLRSCLERQTQLEQGVDLLRHLDELATRLAGGLSADRLSGGVGPPAG